MRLVMIGPPGAGKGTQGAELAGVLGSPHVSTGEMFRHHVSRRTELGRLAAASMEAGEYVPDAITTQMLRERLQADDAQAGFVLDGYPRTPSQVLALDALLADQGVSLTGVIELRLDEEVAARRLLARAEGRADDSEDVVRHRMVVYRQQTAPILEAYVSRGVLLRINAAGPLRLFANLFWRLFGLSIAEIARPVRKRSVSIRRPTLEYHPVMRLYLDLPAATELAALYRKTE